MFISRIRNQSIVDSGGDTLGTLGDVVVFLRTGSQPPRVKGIVMELFARRRVYVPMERIWSIDINQIVVSGALNARRFHRRKGESLVVEDFIDKHVVPRGAASASQIYDVSMVLTRTGEWDINQVALAPVTRGVRFGSRGPVKIVPWNDVAEMTKTDQDALDSDMAKLFDMKPQDIARELHDMDAARRLEVAQALDDHHLAEVIEQLPDHEQVDLISAIDPGRAADVLEEMDPDDAADLVVLLPSDAAEVLLRRMRPEDAQDVRDLLVYGENTVGGMMTPEPLIVAPDATVADALALAREENVPVALAGMVFVCREPLEAPTGKFLGGVHLQRLLREPPSSMVSAVIDTELKPLGVETQLPAVSRYFATYDIVVAPVVDAQSRLLGAVTVDDVLDHMLPDDWRGIQLDEE